MAAPCECEFARYLPRFISSLYRQTNSVYKSYKVSFSTAIATDKDLLQMQLSKKEREGQKKKMESFGRDFNTPI